MTVAHVADLVRTVRASDVRWHDKLGVFTREEAYAICSVGVDLQMCQVVDVPNVVLSSLLPEALLGADRH